MVLCGSSATSQFLFLLPRCLMALVRAQRWLTFAHVGECICRSVINLVLCHRPPAMTAAVRAVFLGQLHPAVEAPALGYPAVAITSFAFDVRREAIEIVAHHPSPSMASMRVSNHAVFLSTGSTYFGIV